jgi:tetratricopeptide (TPR) repeat protein
MRAELATLIPTLRAAKRDLPEDLVIALKNQAHLDIDDGRYQAAETAAQEAVDVGVETLGREHPETVAALLTRAYAYQYSRPPDAALAAAEEAYQTAVAVFRDAPTHPRTIEGRLLYGRALGEAGQPARGVEQLTQAVADAAAVFGPTSRMVGFFSLPLAAFQLETGQVADSLDHSRKALEIIARHTKPQSFRFAAALHQRGASLLAARRPAEALPDLSRATATLKETLPPGHAVTRWFQADEALALARSGRHREAEALAEALLAGAGPATSLGSRARYALGVSKRLSGDAEAALREQRAALTMLRAGSGATTLEVTVLIEIGLALLDLGRPAEATTALEQARDLSRPAQTHLAPDGADILMALGRAAFARGQIAQGCRPIRAAREFWRDFDDGTSEARAAARWLSRCQGS